MITEMKGVGRLVRMITKLFSFTVTKPGFKCVECDALELILQFCYAVAYASSPASLCLEEVMSRTHGLIRGKNGCRLQVKC
jgi:hypothetical protein